MYASRLYIIFEKKIGISNIYMQNSDLCNIWDTFGKVIQFRKITITFDTSS